MAIITQDATGTPQDSPLTVSSTPLALVKPAGAEWLVLRPVGADCRFGDNAVLDGTANEGYAVVLDGLEARIPVRNSGNIWVLRDAAVDVGLGFYYEVLL